MKINDIQNFIENNEIISIDDVALPRVLSYHSMYSARIRILDFFRNKESYKIYGETSGGYCQHGLYRSQDGNIYLVFDSLTKIQIYYLSNSYLQDIFTDHDQGQLKISKDMPIIKLI